jgi:drug/metabolite transporter (DMT)-like permease
MKTGMVTVAVVLLLSTVIWVAVYLAFPDAPLKPHETVLVVFLCLVATAAAQFAWKRLQQRRGRGTRATHK